MQKQPVRRGWASRFSKWLGLQVAGKTIGIALGTPAVIGAVMGGLAYLQSLPLAYGFLAVLLAAASTAVIMNQVRVFWRAYTPANKVFPESALVLHARDAQQKEGYGIAIPIRNSADIPMEYRVTRQHADLNGTVVKGDKDATAGDIIEPHGQRLHMIGLAYIDRLVEGDPLGGDVELIFEYGRPGQLTHEAAFKRHLTVTVGPEGMPVHTNSHTAD